MIPEHTAHQAITLAARDWNVSEIARHLGHDRKTIRIYLNGRRRPGQPRQHAVSFAPFAAYAARRVRDDPHLRVSGLHRELVDLGYAGSYSALTRELRNNRICTHCPTCQPKPASPSTLTPIGLQSDCPAQSLPIRIAPLTGETIASYLRRLAAGNHVPLSLILAHLPSWFTARTITHDDLSGADRIKPASVECLAALTGLTIASLLRALPAFGLGHRDHTRRPPVRAIHACRRCAARHGRTDPVPIHLPAHQRLCRRHRIWLGGACHIDLATAPEVVPAHRRAARLAHRYGVLRLLHTETTIRQQISAACHPDAVQQRVDKMTASNPGLIFEQPDLIEAATYPEVISSAGQALSKTS